MITHNKKQKNITRTHENNMSTQTDSQMTQMLGEAEKSLKEYYKCVQISGGKYSDNEMKYKASVHRNYIYKSKNQ